MLASNLHNIAAGNLDVVQGSDPNDVTVTLPYSFNDIQVFDGSNHGDYNVRLGDAADDDRDTALLLSSVRENNRDNGDGPTQGTSHIAWTTGGGGHYFIPTSPAPAGGEYNVNVAAAFFPYADGWLGGWAVNSSNGGALTTLYGNPDLELGTHFIDNGGGQSTVDLTGLGYDSQTDGILMVVGAKNEDNFALQKANADGTWTVYNRDNGNGSSYEQDPVAFLFVPTADKTVVSGRIMGDTSVEMASQDASVVQTGTGTYRLTIAGYSPADGVLLTSPEGGQSYNQDNVVTYEADGDGWVITSRDLTGMGLQSMPDDQGVCSFLFIPGPEDAGITVDAADVVYVTESGASNTFEVVLDRQPSDDVTIPITSTNTDEATVNVSDLTFTHENWYVPQTVIVTGVDDLDVDGDIVLAVDVGPATSADTDFDGLSGVSVTVANLDNETARIEVLPDSGLVTTEAGGEDTFLIILIAATAPTDTVVVAMDSSDPGEGTALTVEFGGEDWDQPQYVTVTGVDDDVDDGDIAYTIVTTATSGDPIYDGIAVGDVDVTNEDDDTSGVTVDPTSGLVVSENGATADFTVVLTSEPTADVVIGLESDNPVEGLVDPATLTFTAANWNLAQTATVTGQNDGVPDGDIVFSIVTTVTEGDATYLGIDPSDVSVTNLDAQARLYLSSAGVDYGIADPAFLLDNQATIVDTNHANYDTGSLTVTVTNAGANDLLSIRNVGTEAGQIGVDGTDVTYGGTVIGTVAGGDGANPLVISLNDQATVEAAQALLQSITFENPSDTPVLTPRAVEIVLDDGAGGVSNTVTKTVYFVTVRTTTYQQGVDNGAGVYESAADIQLYQGGANTAYPEGGDALGLLVDYDVDGVASNVLLRFEELFGDQAGQIPLGSTILSATLTLDTNNSGDGGTFHRMLMPWDAENATWNSMGAGIQANNVEARAAKDSEVGVVDGSGATGTGPIEIGVAADLQAWADGDTNYGWAMLGWDGNTDGWAFSPSEAVNAVDRPKLTVKWMPSDVSMVSFKQGVDGYTSASDTTLEQIFHDSPAPWLVELFVDAANASNEIQTLMKFQNIVGDAASQIPVGSMVHSAQLVLASTTTHAMGDGGTIHPMLQSWNEDFATWDSFGSGVQANGTEAAVDYTAKAGDPSLTPNVQGGYLAYDLTSDVQAWVNQEMDNNGWAMLPWTGGSDGWGFVSSDGIEAERPELRVYYTEPGITVEPTSGLITTELGDSAEFSIRLQTQPTVDVEIPLTTGDATEGSVSPASLIFTSENWNQYQTVTVTGVDDLDIDGDMEYTVVTEPAVTTDPGYDGLDADDVTLTNIDDETAGVRVVPVEGLVTTEEGGTDTFQIVINKEPTADVTISLTSTDTTEGTVPVSVVFTPGNWSTWQTVTVTGVDDSEIDGPVAYTIETGAPTSDDTDYTALTADDTPDVAVTNIDDDIAGVTVEPTSGLVTTEGGGTDSFTVVLHTIPPTPVLIDVTSLDTTEGTVDQAQLTFDDSNWDVPQLVTVTGADDADDDQDIAYTIELTVNGTSDADYLGVNPDDVSALNIDDENIAPIVTLPGGDVLYGIGTAGRGLDPNATVVDTDPMSFVNYEPATITATLAANATVNDRLFIRNDGTGAGQVGVDGANVTHEGTVVGTFTGGDSVDPLVITFNSDSTVATVQAVLRVVSFSNVSATPDTATRTVEIVVTDELGAASAVATRDVKVGVRQSATYQEGVDDGYGAYTGTGDIQLLESRPDTALTTGGDGYGLLVDYHASGSESRVLLRYEDLIGAGNGQIPVGSKIIAAALVLDTNNSGDGATMHRMLTDWDPETETWNAFGNGVAPRNVTPGVQADDSEARAAYDSMLHVASGASSTGTGTTIFSVTDDVQAWADGDANNGWAMMGWAGRTDGWAFSPSEALNPSDRPMLYVEWVPGDVASAAFQDGGTGYTGTVDTQLQQANPDTDNSGDTQIWTDAANADNEAQILLQFDYIMGEALAQVPDGATVHAAVLEVAGIGSYTNGDGGSFHEMLTPWADTATWNSMVDGVATDDVQAASVYNAQAGYAARTPNVQGGKNSFDVTADVQAWFDGTLDNFGWAMLPWAGGTDGWGFSSSEYATEQYRPELRIYYSTDAISAMDDNFDVATDSTATNLDVLGNDIGSGLEITGVSAGSRGAEVTFSATEVTFTPDAGFVGQEAFTYTMTDGVDSSTATVIVTVGSPTDPYVDFSAVTIDSFNGRQNDVVGLAEDRADGDVLYMTGNIIKSVDYAYTVTPNTILEFDFRSTAQGEVHAVGTDLSIQSKDVFKVYGTQSGNYAIQEDYSAMAPDYKHYEIHLGDHTIGDMTKLWFMNDDDVADAVSNGFFANVRVYEGEARPTMANDDTFAVAENAPATLLDVLANDSGASLSIIAASETGSRGGTVTISGDQLEYTPVTDFVGQEAFTYTMTDGVEEKTATVIVEVGSPADAYVEFNTNSIFSYGGANDVEGTADAEANGASIHVTGNVMKAISLPYTVTANTLLEFDFRSTVEGEVHAIGTNLDNTASGVFKVHGRQGGNYTNLNDYAPAATEYLHYEVYLGDYVTGGMAKLWFMNDHDVPSPNSEGYFANVRISEDADRPAMANDDAYPVTVDTATTLDVLANDFGAGLTISGFSQGSQGGVVTEDAGQLEYTPAAGFVGQEALTYTMTDGVTTSTGTVIVTVGTPADPYIDFRQYNVMSYGGAANDVEGTVAVETGGAVLHIGGNVMKAIPLSYTITANTVLEFDFRSTMEGEVHAIGSNGYKSAAGVFKVYGTQNGAYTNLEDYAPTAPEFKHYSIDLGSYTTSAMSRLWFMNDHDVPNPDSNGYFANVRIYEGTGAGESGDGSGSPESGLLLPITIGGGAGQTLASNSAEGSTDAGSAALLEAKVDPIAEGLIPELQSTGSEAVDRAFAGDENGHDVADLLDDELLDILAGE